MLHRFILLTILALLFSFAACNGDDDDNDDSDDDNNNEDDNDDDSSDDDDNDDLTPPEGWRMELVDDNHAGRHNNLLFSPSFEPVIVYYRDNNYDTIPAVAEKNGAAWNIEQLDATEANWDLHFTMDSTGYGHVAFYAFSPETINYDLLYATNKSGAWEIQRVEEDLTTLFEGCGLALNAADEPFFVYENRGFVGNEYLESVFLAAWNGDGWDSERIATGAEPTMAIDKNDVIHVVYRTPCDVDLPTADCGKLMYAVKTADEWQFETIDELDENNADPGFTPYEFSDLLLELDENGFAHLVYRVHFWDDPEEQNHYIFQTKYASNVGGTWESSLVRDRSYLLNAALDPAGKPHILLSDTTESEWRVWRYAKSESTWESECLNLPSNPVDLFIDADGFFHLSYAELTDMGDGDSLYYLTNRPQ